MSATTPPPVVACHGHGLIDRAKVLRHRVLDYALPQRFVFHHVPKCGGTSVSRALRKRYLPSQATVLPEASFRAFAAFSGRMDTERMLVDVLDLREQMLLYLMFADTRCIAAHVRFSEAAYLRFAGTYKFATILRDPVSRFLSHFNWSHSHLGAHAEIREDFDAFLHTKRAARMGATYVEYFSGLPKEADIRTEVAIGRAVANLRRFDVVGRLDDLGAFSSAIRDRLGVRVRFGHENKARDGGGVKLETLTAAQIEMVQSHCTPDIKVWNQVS